MGSHSNSYASQVWDGGREPAQGSVDLTASRAWRLTAPGNLADGPLSLAGMVRRGRPRRLRPGRRAPAGAADDLVLEQVVRDAPGRRGPLPGGRDRTGRLHRGPPAAHRASPTDPAPGSAGPDLTITCDWATATELAQGTLSAQAALMAGRLRVSGNMARLSGRAADLVGLDPVPDVGPAPDHLLTWPPVNSSDRR